MSSISRSLSITWTPVSFSKLYICLDVSRSSTMTCSAPDSFTNSFISSALPEPIPYWDRFRYFWVKTLMLWRSAESTRLFASSWVKLSGYVTRTTFLDFWLIAIRTNPCSLEPRTRSCVPGSTCGLLQRSSRTASCWCSPRVHRSPGIPHHKSCTLASALAFDVFYQARRVSHDHDIPITYKKLQATPIVGIYMARCRSTVLLLQ